MATPRVPPSGSRDDALLAAAAKCNEVQPGGAAVCDVRCQNDRGIFSTCYAPIIDGKLPSGAAGKKRLQEIFRAYYKDMPFVDVTDVPPQTKQTLGNNMCLVYPTFDERTNRLMVFSCIDNLVKGAAGQAIQNMNLMLGYPETMGIDQVALFP